MMFKVKVNRRDNRMYPYSISYMNREDVLLTRMELLDLYDQITQIILDEELWL